MAGSDPWARVVYIVARGFGIYRGFDSAWTDRDAAERHAATLEAGSVTLCLPLDQPSGDVIAPSLAAIDAILDRLLSGPGEASIWLGRDYSIADLRRDLEALRAGHERDATPSFRAG